jgi:hypothetical protein
VVYQPEGSSAETLTQNTDYWLLPYNAAADLEPWTALELRRGFPAPPHPDALHRAIRVTGTWGWAASIPEDAWEAIRDLAFLWLLPHWGLNLSGGGRQMTVDAGVTRQYGTDPAGGARRAMDERIRAAVGRYRRISL